MFCPLSLGEGRERVRRHACRSFGPPQSFLIPHHDLTVLAIEWRPFGPRNGVSTGSDSDRVRREAPRCNSPDRQVGVNVSIKGSRPDRADMIHAGPSDLFNHSQSITTTSRSWLL